MFCGGVVSVVTVTPTSVRGSVKFMNVASVNVIVTAFTGADHDTRVNARTRVETWTRFMSSSVLGAASVVVWMIRTHVVLFESGYRKGGSAELRSQHAYQTSI